MIGLATSIKKLLGLLVLWLLFPITSHASFIESTIGTAVVNDATATYFNPAALSLLKNTQFIALGSIADSHTSFSGKITRSQIGLTQSGLANTNTHYYLPSIYFAKPASDKVTYGLAIIANSFNRGIEENSILRYNQSSNRVQSIDFVPAASIKLNEILSFGAALNLTYADILLRPISGFPNLNIPDRQSSNEGDATSLGEDVGLLLKPTKSTLIGINYRSAITYRFRGKSILEGEPGIISKNYRFHFWIPARSIISINQFVTPKLGFISTVQYIQWSIFKNVTIQGIATQFGSQPIIVNATVPFHLQDAWVWTVGSHYRITPKWIVRVAGTFNQSPGNPKYQISNGDSVIAGASMSYEIQKNILIDGSYAHAFFQNENIHIANANTNSLINGINKATRDSVSLKLTVNLD